MKLSLEVETSVDAVAVRFTDCVLYDIELDTELETASLGDMVFVVDGSLDGVPCDTVPELENVFVTERSRD